jgi:hypothetical protein
VEQNQLRRCRAGDTAATGGHYAKTQQQPRASIDLVRHKLHPDFISIAESTILNHRAEIDTTDSIGSVTPAAQAMANIQAWTAGGS